LVRLSYSYLLIDHVALILKFDAESDELFFLDATSNLVN